MLISRVVEDNGLFNCSMMLQQDLHHRELAIAACCVMNMIIALDVSFCVLLLTTT